MARKSRKHLYDAPDEKVSPVIEKIYMAGIYARTSSREQKGNSAENQKYIAERYIKEKPDIELHKVYVDYGISSFERTRLGFEEMILDIESKSINCVIVKDISRFTRDYLEAGDYLQRKFPIWGVRFISVGNNFDSLHGDATQLGLVLQSLLYYYYSIDLSKKIQVVIDKKQKTGTYIPAKLPYGYKKVRIEQGVQWTQDEQNSLVVQQIFNDALSGFSAFAIAGRLNEQKIPAPSSEFWSSGNIIRILKNMSYTGTFVTRKTRNNIIDGRETIQLPPETWIKHHSHHAPIVDDITFYAVQRIISDRRSFISKRGQSDDFFCGKLFCGICGRKMRLKRSGNGSLYYICPQRDAAGSSCPNKAKSETKLKKQIFLSLMERLNDLRTCYQNTIAYEKSLYFLRKADKQDKTIQTYEKELERQFQVFKRIFEESVIKHTNRSADIQGLLQHLMRIRTILQERLADVVRMRDDYQVSESSNSTKFRLYFKFRKCNELTSQMLDEMVEKVLVDMDRVRVMEKG
jgi:hypothetical protein